MTKDDTLDLYPILGVNVTIYADCAEIRNDVDGTAVYVHFSQWLRVRDYIDQRMVACGLLDEGEL